jgi:tetratricopeptide (TPR) repeat protein
MIVPAVASSCGCGGEKETEPEYERLIPPATDVPSEPAQNPSLLPDLDALQLSVAMEPENAFVRFEYLSALDQLGKTQEAIEEARALAAIEEDNPFRAVAYLNLAEMVLNDLPADAANRSELVKEGMDALWKGLGEEPGSVPMHLALGRLALEDKDYDRALHHLAIALAATEIGYELRIRMAEIYIEREDYGKARAHLEAARELAEEAQDREAVRKINGLMSQLK